MNNVQINRLVAKWYPEDDPILKSQLETLGALLADIPLTAQALEGFLVVCSRFVDGFGRDRVNELGNIFQTQHVTGRRALFNSLIYMDKWVGGMQGYLSKYPVEIETKKPAFPLFKIIGIESIVDQLYRVLDSNSEVHGSTELVKDYILRTGRLPPVPILTEPVLRSKPKLHWCTYRYWDTPKLTSQALQILPEWGNCQLRATIPTNKVKKSAFLAFNGDTHDKWCFHQYFYEPLAQDHPPQAGGGQQIALQGAPVVSFLELWNPRLGRWEGI